MISAIESAALAEDEVLTTFQRLKKTPELHKEPDQVRKRQTAIKHTAMRNTVKRQSRGIALPTGKRRRIGSICDQSGTVDMVETRGQISELAHKTRRICLRCQSIDFQAILNEDTRKAKPYKLLGRSRYDLSRIDPQSSCALCRFFYSVREPAVKGNAEQTGYYLEIFPAKGEFGAWDLPFEDTPGFKVIPLQHRPFSLKANGLVVELSEAQKSFCGREVQPQVDLSIIKEWLSFCDDHHNALCKQKADPQVPTDFRVIDCTTRKIVP